MKTLPKNLLLLAAAALSSCAGSPIANLFSHPERESYGAAPPAPPHHFTEAEADQLIAWNRTHPLVPQQVEVTVVQQPTPFQIPQQHPYDSTEEPRPQRPPEEPRPQYIIGNDGQIKGWIYPQ
jgi:hypothetical protein